MATYYVTRSRKQDGGSEHEMIVGVCIDNTFYTKAQIYDFIIDGHSFFARRSGFPDVGIMERMIGGVKYIQTNPDEYKQNNLLNLPDC